MAGRKQLPFAKSSAKPKVDTKTYIFELKIEESDENTYSEFSWKDLVDAEKRKSGLVSSTKGKTSMEVCLSDDEESLKATAAKLEKRYKADQRTRRKRRAEDYIDRGAGYDEEDSFIDNTDAYDEVVPAEIETVRGGFYVNSGTLDFKEVYVSEVEDEEPDNVFEGGHESIDIDEDSSEAAKENKKSSRNGNQSTKKNVIKQPVHSVSTKGSSSTASAATKAVLKRRSILRPKRNKISNKSVSSVKTVTK